MLSSYNNPSRIKTMSTRTMSLNYYMNSIFLSGLISLILLSNTPNHFFFIFFFFFFNDTPTPEIYTLPLHDALPIFHLYEGHAPAVAALPPRMFARLGVRTLIVTNAAGGIRHTFRPPTLMLIADHINLMFRNPL